MIASLFFLHYNEFAKTLNTKSLQR